MRADVGAHERAHERAHEQDRSGEPDGNRSGRGGAAVTGGQARLLALQRQAGNAAVTAALAGRAPAPVQRLFPPIPIAVLPRPGRTVETVTCKRRHIDLGQGQMGHWWTEINGNESYAWWPKSEGSVWDALFGTEGELNAVSHPSMGGTPTRDPYHGQAAEESFHPKCTDPAMDDSAIHSKMRTYAQGYSGSWRWTLGGTDCHVFQERMLGAASCREPSSLDSLGGGEPMVA